ncbi:MAG: hypothetical protein Q8M26_16500 [Pseudolabrys sp.]|nr:hypothetical protein [Pseudolabrys sp.]
MTLNAPYLTMLAALILGTGVAVAQTTDLPPEPAPPAQQNAPAEIIAPPMNAGERKAPATTGQDVPTELAPGKGESVTPNSLLKEPSGKDATDMKGSSDVGNATK